MKKYFILALLCLIQLTNTANADPSLKIKVRFRYHCDAGFGFCPVLTGHLMSDYTASVQITNDKNRLVLFINQFDLSDELNNEFQSGKPIVIDELALVDDVLIKAFDLPSGSTIVLKDYPVEQIDNNYKITFEIE